MSAQRASLWFVVAFSSAASASAQETTDRVSVDSSGAQGNGASGLYDAPHNYSFGSSISGDASVVAFSSGATNLVASDTNGKWDIFIHDRTSGSTELISVDSSGAQGDNHSRYPSCSVDGSWIAFESDATTLVAGDTNGVTDIFLRDRFSGTTERVSVDSAGNQANKSSTLSAVSADGQIVAFSSAATNLVSGDANGHIDVFVHDRSTGVTECVSVDSSGKAANGDSGAGLSITPDGRFVVFSSSATNLVANDTNGHSDVFIHDRAAGTTELVSLTSSGSQADGDSSSGRGPTISSDGSIVAFMSLAKNLGAGSTGQVFVRDRSAGTTELASILPPGMHDYNGSSGPSLSADGMAVAFWSDINYAVLVRDRVRRVTELMSVDSSGKSGYAMYPTISADGQVVEFESTSNLVPNDTNGVSDIFVHERCEVVASWSTYGQGYPGTNGIPTLTARSNPVRGASLTLDVGNSSGSYSFGVLELGYQRANIPSSWGGDLLVLPALTLAVGLTPTGLALSGDLPDDDRVCGVALDLQVMEADPGAAHGVSFTPGLELIVGQ